MLHGDRYLGHVEPTPHGRSRQSSSATMYGSFKLSKDWRVKLVHTRYIISRKRNKFPSHLPDQEGTLDRNLLSQLNSHVNYNLYPEDERHQSMSWSSNHLMSDPVTLVLRVTQADPNDFVQRESFRPSLNVPVFGPISQILSAPSQVLET